MVRIKSYRKKYMYHGTQERCLTGIAKHGLLPSSKTGIVSWPEMAERTRNMIFLDEEKGSARNWACGESCMMSESMDSKVWEFEDENDETTFIIDGRLSR